MSEQVAAEEIARQAEAISWRFDHLSRVISGAAEQMRQIRGRSVRRTSVWTRPMIELVRCHDEDCACVDDDWWEDANHTCRPCYVQRLPCVCALGVGDAACWRAGDPIYRSRP